VNNVPAPSVISPPTVGVGSTHSGHDDVGGVVPGGDVPSATQASTSF
jgi:hypothetical protein